MPDYTTSQHHRKRYHHKNRVVTTNMLRAMVPKPEAKWFDRTFQQTLGITNGPVPLDLIVQGAGQNQRIGDSVKAKSSFVRYTLTRGAADSFVRVIHFIWKSNDIPQATDVLAVASGGQQTVSPLNRDNGRTLRIIHDRLYTLGSGQDQLQVEKWSKKMYFTNKYDSDGATTTSINGYYVLFVSDQTVAANQPTINYYHRLSYTDS